jgi:hypothetical protein
MNCGDTFLRPTVATATETPHLWVVVTNPNAENLVLIVNFTSLKDWQDQTVMLNVGDHPFITEQTVIFYREAEIVDNAKLDEAARLGAVSQRHCCSKQIIDLIRAGVNASPQTKRVIKTFYNKHK